MTPWAVYPYMPQPFEIREINTIDRLVVVAIRADMLGSVANQLKDCPDGRKAAPSTRRLGYALAAAGDKLFGKEIEHPDLKDSLVTG